MEERKECRGGVKRKRRRGGLKDGKKGKKRKEEEEEVWRKDRLIAPSSKFETV